jgi:hypothetical protein
MFAMFAHCDAAKWNKLRHVHTVSSFFARALILKNNHIMQPDYQIIMQSRTHEPTAMASSLTKQ